MAILSEYGKWRRLRYAHRELKMVRTSLAIYLTIIALGAPWHCSCTSSRIAMTSDLSSSISSGCQTTSCICTLAFQANSGADSPCNIDSERETSECTCSVHSQSLIGPIKARSRQSRQSIGDRSRFSQTSWIAHTGVHGAGVVQVRLIGKMVASQESLSGTELRVIFHILRC